MKLYEIDERIMALLESAVDEETGEINPEMYGELDALQQMKEDKIESVLLYKKGVDADIDSVKKEIERLSGIKESLERKSDGLKRYAMHALNGEKLKTNRISVYYRKNEIVDFTGNIESLDEKFIRRKDPEINKAEIKAFLKSGGKIDGAKLVETTSMIIK